MSVRHVLRPSIQYKARGPESLSHFHRKGRDRDAVCLFLVQNILLGTNADSAEVVILEEVFWGSAPMAMCVIDVCHCRIRCTSSVGRLSLLASGIRCLSETPSHVLYVIFTYKNALHCCHLVTTFHCCPIFKRLSASVIF